MSVVQKSKNMNELNPKEERLERLHVLSAVLEDTAGDVATSSVESEGTSERSDEERLRRLGEYTGLNLGGVEQVRGLHLGAVDE